MPFTTQQAKGPPLPMRIGRKGWRALGGVMAALSLLTGAAQAESEMASAAVAQQSLLPITEMASDCAGSLCNTQALAPFFEALQQAGSRRVHILQIGDSHTAGDLITQGWRAPMQSRFGNGGRGVLAAGRPYRNFLSFGVTVQADSAWRTNGTFGNKWQDYGPAIGLASYTHTANSAGAWLSLTADTPQDNFEEAMICGLTGPSMGAVAVQFGGRDYEVDFSEGDEWSSDGARCFQFETSWPTTGLSIVTRDERPVSLTSFAALSRTGVTLSNLGVSGSQLLHFARTNDAVLRQELAAYQPDLIIFAYGTNEGFAGEKNLSDYHALLTQQIARMKRLAGRNVPVLLIGPPDALTVRHHIAYSSISPPVACTDRLMTPGLLLDVRSVQQQVAREQGAAYWDWMAAMGGVCSAMQWKDNGEMASDYVHFTKTGSPRIGQLLYGDLDRARIAYNLNR